MTRKQRFKRKSTFGKGAEIAHEASAAGCKAVYSVEDTMLDGRNSGWWCNQETLCNKAKGVCSQGFAGQLVQEGWVDNCKALLWKLKLVGQPRLLCLPE